PLRLHSVCFASAALVMLLGSCATTHQPRIRGNLECDIGMTVPCGAKMPRSHADEWCARVEGAQLAFVGTFASRETTGARSWMRQLSVRCAVNQVLTGAADSTVVTFRSPNAYSNECLKPGAIVLVTLAQVGDQRDSLKLVGGLFPIN